jgi:hypothetical protein
MVNNASVQRYVLPDGPTTRGAATSWRVYLVVAGMNRTALAMLGSNIHPDQREGPRRSRHHDRYTRH